MSAVVVARTGRMRTVGELATGDQALGRGDRCIVRTPRGTELAEVLLPPRPADEGRAPPLAPGGEVLRRATAEDLARGRYLEETVEKGELRLARKTAREAGLGMKVLCAEHLFGGERVVFYFRSDQRVEVPALARALEAELGTRVELRQVAAREEMRLFADVGHCGLPACERTFVREIGPVSMRMAMVQKDALDPNRITDACGLLMYCVRFEHLAYKRT